tara:strand:+ start:10895 stop:11284 length:390 start_codon:yes stop_codon:yes gene_type:complete
MSNLNHIKEEPDLKEYQKQLISQVDAIAKEIETGKFYNKRIKSASDYLNSLDDDICNNIVHRLNQNGEYLGAEITVSSGGVVEPDITIHTRSNKIVGFMRGDNYTIRYCEHEDIDLDEALEDLLFLLVE